MTTIRPLQRWLAAGIGLAIAACGGGGSSGGIGGTGNEPGVAYGTITGFGSVIVNGVKFDTSNTIFKTDDNPNGGSQGDLRVGMVVRVDGSIANKTAATITEDSSLKGLVEQVLGSDRFVVMGQTVQTDATTRFETNNRPVVGERVEVHGLIAGDGVFSAGFIERKPSTPLPNPAFVVKGIVKAHTTATQSFQIGALTVQYGGAAPGNLPTSGSWNGLQVEAKGNACTSPAPACGALVATQLSLAGVQITKDGTQAEIEGVVVALAADGFTIGNQRVVTSAATRYEGGVLADLLVGTQVEVEGSVSGGVLTATKVSFHDGLRVEGDIASVSGNDLTIAGLPGTTVVSLTSFTELKDVTGALQPGNHLRVRGKPGLGNTLIATRLELRSATTDPRVELQAAVQTASPETSLRLLGVDIATGSGLSYRDAGGATISRTAFFAAATAGKLVKAKGTLVGGAVTWTELELQN